MKLSAILLAFLGIGGTSFAQRDVIANMNVKIDIDSAYLLYGIGVSNLFSFGSIGMDISYARMIQGEPKDYLTIGFYHELIRQPLYTLSAALSGGVASDIIIETVNPGYLVGNFKVRNSFKIPDTVFFFEVLGGLEYWRILGNGNGPKNRFFFSAGLGFRAGY